MDTNRDWIGELRTGGEPSLADAFASYRPRLRHVVEVRLGTRLNSRVDPSDVLQETFLDARRQLERYLDDPRVSVFVWLRELANQRLSNLRRDHLHAQRRAAHRELVLSDNSSLLLAERLVGRGATPSQFVSQEERCERVRRAVESLPESDRDIIVLRYFEFLTNREAAEVLGIAETAASMRHGRALLRLRRALDGLGGSRHGKQTSPQEKPDHE